MRTHRSLNSIVEHEIRKWKLEKSKKKREDVQKIQPVITISRQCGSQGALIGKEVAKQLDYSFWDQELVHEIAQQTGAPEAMFQSIDEHRRNAIAEMLSVFSSADSGVSKDRYVPELFRVIHSVGAHGRAVIIGRGAQFILSPAQAFRVRVVGPIEQRIAGLASRTKVTKKKVQRQIAEVDSNRRDFIFQTYRQDIADPMGYDMILNIGNLSLSRAAALLVAAYRVANEEDD
jgi:cytidylate kinase